VLPSSFAMVGTGSMLITRPMGKSVR
jgi:hypothetical protein